MNSIPDDARTSDAVANQGPFHASRPRDHSLTTKGVCSRPAPNQKLY